MLKDRVDKGAEVVEAEQRAKISATEKKLTSATSSYKLTEEPTDQLR